MRLFGQILFVCVLLSVLKALVVAIAVAVVLLLVWGLFFRTPETVGLIAFCLLIEALQVYPVATIGLIVVLFVVVWIARIEPSDKPTSDDRVALLPPPPLVPSAK